MCLCVHVFGDHASSGAGAGGGDAGPSWRAAPSVLIVETGVFGETAGGAPPAAVDALSDPVFRASHVRAGATFCPRQLLQHCGGAVRAAASSSDCRTSLGGRMQSETNPSYPEQCEQSSTVGTAVDAKHSYRWDSVPAVVCKITVIAVSSSCHAAGRSSLRV